MLHNFVTDGAIEHAVAFSMQAEMFSGPLALAISSELKSSMHNFVHTIGVHRELVMVKFALFFFGY